MTKFTITSHGDGHVEVEAELCGGVKPSELIEGVRAHVAVIAAHLNSTAEKVITGIILLQKAIEARPDSFEEKMVEVKIPHTKGET